LLIGSEIKMDCKQRVKIIHPQKKKENFFRENKKLFIIIFVFVIFYFLPLEIERLREGIYEALALTKEYAREHVIFSLLPAFFVAGAISVFVNKASVMKYFGAQARKTLSYSVASLSGAVLTVCSCTILPLFMSIYQRGAGLGPAITFLYSGPAINVLAIVLTARILGVDIGLARAVGAVFASVFMGLMMHLIFLKDENKRQANNNFHIESRESKPLFKTALPIVLIILFMVFANFKKPDGETLMLSTLYNLREIIALLCIIFVVFLVYRWYREDEIKQWLNQTLSFGLSIVPYLFAGILLAGFLFGRIGHEGLIPSEFVSSLVGGNSLRANFIASLLGAFMYFASCTEVPILQGLIGAGMGKGPALALLLSGPALSLPSMLIIAKAIGFKKTAVYVVLVVIVSTLFGFMFGNL